MIETTGQPDTKFSLLNWLGWFFALNFAWLLLAVLAVLLGWRSYNLTANGTVTQGTVVQLLEDEVSFTSDFTPIVEFQVEGETYSIQSQNTYRWWNRYFRFPIGKQVEVRYDPSNPESAEIDSWLDLWGEPVILGVFTIITAIGVNVYLLWRWRSQRNKQAAHK